MNARAPLLAVLTLTCVAGCTLTMEPRPLAVPPQLAPAGDPGRPIAVVGKALVPRQIEMPVGWTTWRLDPGGCAEALEAAVAGTLADRGYALTDNAADKLEILLVYTTLVPGPWRVVCYVDVTASTSGGYLHGFQARGQDVGARTACAQALTEIVTKILADAEIEAFLTGERRDSNAAAVPGD